ncbi:galactokinase [Streptomyces sp. CB01881]|uniref:galactokinase n=1 Tax=Streptomyces sp. CB01881 TaxID=2078691 RepID=UPI000CDBC7F8|nr:galactokinase [Streptomyces sp. CB01881]AUY47729.1 galactokinase [Streptomyces sp. CB01881]TYC76205.1 galactokinase [Streptomyces sp. CB01881]
MTATSFQGLYGHTPDGEWAAPGRVNLIGEHTDYNDGFVLPIALPQAARVQARRRDDGLLRLHSTRSDGPPVELDVAALAPGAVPGWAAYPAGVVWTLGRAGHPVGGADLLVDSDVPSGAGLSSSAALECAVATAYRDLYRLDLDNQQLALIAQRAENEFAGVPCGMMDQMASMVCRAGAALHLDTRDLAVRHVPFDPAAAGLTLLVIDTRVKHDLGDGAYAALRAGCERAAALLGLPALRDLPAADLGDALAGLPDELRPLVRHVVTENDRVREAVALLDGGDPAALGPVLTAGHASLRDDFRVSCAETDLAVEAAVAAGALGARMTGGGFGGSVIALAPDGAAAAVTTAVTRAFAEAGHTAPLVFPTAPAAGAHRLA